MAKEIHNHDTPERVPYYERGEGTRACSIARDVEGKEYLHGDERYREQCQAILWHANFR